jgi:hypothetical protein
MSANTYWAKKLIRPVTLNLQRIHACPNHCILYPCTQYVSFESYLHCDTSRYKEECQVMRELQVGQRRRPPRRVVRGKSCLISRRKKVTRRGEFLPCWCGTFSWSIAYVVYSGTSRMPSWCLGMHLVIAQRTMTTYDTLLMPGSGSISMPCFRSLAMSRGTLGSHWVPTGWTR